MKKYHAMSLSLAVLVFANCSGLYEEQSDFNINLVEGLKPRAYTRISFYETPLFKMLNKFMKTLSLPEYKQAAFYAIDIFSKGFVADLDLEQEDKEAFKSVCEKMRGLLEMSDEIIQASKSLNAELRANADFSVDAIELRQTKYPILVEVEAIVEEIGKDCYQLARLEGPFVDVRITSEDFAEFFFKEHEEWHEDESGCFCHLLGQMIENLN